MTRIGILGGTFNPPHLGHLVCAQEALDRLGLDRVLLMPVSEPPHKALECDPGADARVVMCRLAVEGDERLEVSTLEVERGGPSYTVDTLRELHARAPEDDLTFIVGADMAESLATWRSPGEVLRLARLAVAERGDSRREDIMRAVASLHDGTRVVFFEMPRIDVSSSMLRRRVAEGRPVRYLLPDSVAAEIAASGLYREDAHDVPMAGREAHR